MRPKVPHKGRMRPGHWLAIFFALLAGLAFLGFGSSQSGLADGGVPSIGTATVIPTVTPTFFLALPSPTSPFYPMATLPLVITGERPASSGFCWPFALTLIIVVMLTSMVLIRRQS